MRKLILFNCWKFVDVVHLSFAFLNAEFFHVLCTLQLAKKYHPDVNRNDPSSQKRFQEVSEAYEVNKLMTSLFDVSLSLALWCVHTSKFWLMFGSGIYIISCIPWQQMANNLNEVDPDILNEQFLMCDLVKFIGSKFCF